MNVLRLVFREMAHRKRNVFWGLVSVVVAVGCLAGSLTVLESDRRLTERVLEEKQQEVEAAGAALEEAMRKITKGLGFNVIVLPQDQDLNELHLEGSLSRTMPEDYVNRLAASRIVTINHLLPTVVKKVNWPETGQSVFLHGTRGEVPILHADPKKQLLDAVPEGTMIVGYETGRSLGLKREDQTRLLGRDFKVLKVHEQRGTRDDSSVWINLKEAQELLGMQNLIHAIQALECQCAGDRIGQIRKEIEAILPGTQVIERGPPALARAEARNRAKEAAEEGLRMEAARRSQIREQRERVAARLVPLSIVVCTVFMGLLAYGNVRQRFPEIAVLRALGFASGRIFALFMVKAAAIGGVGGVTGYGCGLIAGTLSHGASVGQLFSLPVFLGAVLAAFALAVLGSWLPAVVAVRADPAVILQEE